MGVLRTSGSESSRACWSTDSSSIVPMLPSTRYHTTFVLVTHDEHLAERCDRIVHLVDGRLARDTSIRVQ